MNFRMVAGIMIALIPVVIVGRLLPGLLLLAPLFFLCALGKVYVEKWAERRQKRRWTSFSTDREYWASGSPGLYHDGAIKIDLTHRWIAFHLSSHETPRCFSAASIKSCRLVGENCIEMTVRGVVYPFQAYSETGRDAKRIVAAIDALRGASARMAVA